MKTAPFLLSLLSLAGCSPAEVNLPALGDVPRPSPVAVEGALRVGTARVDVTPAPGPSTFGHGPDAYAASGYWSRLYCRVFVLETEPGYPLAIVPCDLAAIGTALHREVGRRLHPRLPADRLMLSATHTHAGPAHYFEGPAYGGATSTRLPGFDSAMLEFLADRIAQGLRDALDHMRPARARWNHSSLWGLTRNRSLHAFRNNTPELLASFPKAPEPSLAEAQKAIDPALDVLQLEELDPARPGVVLGPLGTLAWFAMHPTVLPAQTRMFNADAFGVASREVERELVRARASRGAPPADPLAGIVNTNEGDMSPSWIEGTADEAMRIGQKLGRAIWATHTSGSPWRDRLRIDSRYVEEDLPGAFLRDGSRLCPTAMLGESSSHGGSDHHCSFQGMFPGEPEYDPKGDPCHFPKRKLMGLVQNALVPREGFPTHVPLALVRIDDTWIAHVPAELTIAAGRLVDQAVLRQVPRVEDGRTSYAIVGGLTNGYIQYVATAREYQVQAYEGGSTLYGPNSAAFLAERFELLAGMMRWDLADGDRPRAWTGSLPAFHVHFAPQRDRLARPGDDVPLDRVPGRLARDNAKVCTVLRDPPTLCMTWHDGGPGRVGMTRAPWIRAAREDGAPVRVSALLPAGTIATAEPGGALDDRGLGFQTHARDREGRRWGWTTVWRPTREEWRETLQGGKVRLEAADVVSPSFGADVLSVPCKPEVAAACIAN